MGILAPRDDTLRKLEMTSESHLSPPSPHHIWSDFKLPPPSPYSRRHLYMPPNAGLFLNSTNAGLARSFFTFLLWE